MTHTGTRRVTRWLAAAALGCTSPAPAHAAEDSAGLEGPACRVAPQPAAASALDRYGRLPLRFEANRGQTSPRVDFLARGRGFTLFLTREEAVLSLLDGERTTALRMRLEGGRPAPRVRALDPLEGRSHYLRGEDPAGWTTHVPAYGRVRYEGVLPGIDLVYHGRHGRLGYDFVVAPGADPAAIRLVFQGARDLRIEGGQLRLETAAGTLTQTRPVVFQEVDDERRFVAGSYSLSGETVGFRLGAYDRSRELVIDPALVYSTFLGGAGDDAVEEIATDAAGNAYLIGETTSAAFPLDPPTLDGTFGGTTEAFVTKLAPSGSALVYSTYLGGNGTDHGRSIAVDAAGSAYVVGSTRSTDFPRVNAFQNAIGGTGFTDAFLSKLSADGSSLVFSTYLGGAEDDVPFGVAVDGSSRAVVAGYTDSADFPTQSALQSTLAGPRDVFVTRFDVAGTTVVYSTYLGGAGEDEARDVATDASGTALLVGNTASADFPRASALFNTYGGGVSDAFVTKLNAAGSALQFSTFLPGLQEDVARGVDLDGSGNVYVTGFTRSTNFPTASAFDGTLSAAPDAFVTKLAANGGSLAYSTFLGGTGADVGTAIAVDSQGRAFVTGETNSMATTFPLFLNTQGYGGGQDAFVTGFNAAGSALVYSSYLGGTGNDSAVGIDVDDCSNVYVAGETSGSNFPRQNAFQNTFGGGATDAFATRIVTVDTGTIAAPSITSPSAGQMIGVRGVTLGWSAVTSGGANLYDLLITEPSTGKIAFSGQLSGSASTSALVTLVSGGYRFQVRACVCTAGTATCGAFSSPVDFTVNLISPASAPTISAPAQDATLTASTQTFSWSSVSGSPGGGTVLYEVLLEDLTGGTTDLQISTSGLSTIFSLHSSTQYRLRVRACQQGCGPYSAARTFAVDLPPVPTGSPTITSAVVTGNQLDASWTAVANADLYELRVIDPDGGPGGGALTVGSRRVPTTSVAGLPLPAGAFDVVVRACNGDGCGSDGPAQPITVAGPNPSTSNVAEPTPGVIVNGPVVSLSWNRVAGDNGSNTTYQLYVQDLSRQAAALNVFTTQNFYSAFLKAEGNRYDAVVMGPSGQGSVSGFNVAGASAAAPTMTTPPHNGTVVAGNVDLAWSPVPNATLYEYFVAVLGQPTATVRGVPLGLQVKVPLVAAGGAPTLYSAIARACPAGATCAPGSDAGWGPWSNDPGGPGVTNFTVTP